MSPSDVLARKRINLPGWIRETPPFTAEIRELFFQSRVVFYPGGGTDGHPIKLFSSSGAAFCFVYADQAGCDYGQDPAGYEIVHNEDVSWQGRKRPFHFSGEIPRAARWIIFQRKEGYGPGHGHEFIAVLYVHGEAFTVYWDLWARNGKAPYAIIIVDHGFGGNFTGRRFVGQESPMYEWANSNNAWPDWLLVSELGSTETWPGYHCVSTGVPGGMHNDQRFLFVRATDDPPLDQE